MKRVVLGSAVFALVWTLLAPQPVHSQGDSAAIGEIGIFAGSYAPMNWAFCDGKMLPIAQHQALFSLLGARYGGNGQSTFALPDLREAEKKLVASPGADNYPRYIICLEGLYPPRP